jgi:hypothetical protein
MKYKVYALCFDRNTGEQIRHSETGHEPSIEEIDTEKNEMFDGCKSILEVKKVYESFWNDLNDYSDLVFVVRIDKIIE